MTHWWSTNMNGIKEVEDHVIIVCSKKQVHKYQEAIDDPYQSLKHWILKEC